MSWILVLLKKAFSYFFLTINLMKTFRLEITQDIANYNKRSVENWFGTCDQKIGLMQIINSNLWFTSFLIVFCNSTVLFLFVSSNWMLISLFTYHDYIAVHFFFLEFSSLCIKDSFYLLRAKSRLLLWYEIRTKLSLNQGVIMIISPARGAPAKCLKSL